MKKYLPPQFACLLDRSFYGKTVTLVCFPDDKLTVTSNCLLKTQKKIKNKDVDVLYFARCLTIEAEKIICESNGTAFALIGFPWTDDRYNRIRSGI